MLEIILVAAARPVRPGEAYRGASELDFFRRLNTNDGAIASRSLATARPQLPIACLATWPVMKCVRVGLVSKYS